MRWGVPESEAAGGRALLASGSFDHTVKIWDAESGACLQTLQQHQAVSQLPLAAAGGHHRLPRHTAGEGSRAPCSFWECSMQP